MYKIFCLLYSTLVEFKIYQFKKISYKGSNVNELESTTYRNYIWIEFPPVYFSCYALEKLFQRMVNIITRL